MPNCHICGGPHGEHPAPHHGEGRRVLDAPVAVKWTYLEAHGTKQPTINGLATLLVLGAIYLRPVRETMITVAYLIP